MIELSLDIWSVHDPSPASKVWIGITTNGIVKRDGCLVMGRGVAAQAKSKLPNIDLRLGTHVTDSGNTILMMHDLKAFSFPVKHHWHDRADLELIRASAIDLKTLIDCEHHRGSTFYLPRPGCGNGGLTWQTQVKPVLQSVDLPDNVFIVSMS